MGTGSCSQGPLGSQKGLHRGPLVGRVWWHVGGGGALMSAGSGTQSSQMVTLSGALVRRSLTCLCRWSFLLISQQLRTTNTVGGDTSRTWPCENEGCLELCSQGVKNQKCWLIGREGISGRVHRQGSSQRAGRGPGRRGRAGAGGLSGVSSALILANPAVSVLGEKTVASQCLLNI